MADKIEVGSPEWWRDRLIPQLDAQAKRVAFSEQYFDGTHRVPEPPQSMNAAVFAEAKVAFQTLSRLGITNLMPLVAKAPADRLSIRGFRFGEQTAQADDPVWQCWQRNHMDADHRLLIDTAMTCGNAYALVWADDDDKAEVTCEHPSQMIVAYKAGSRRKRAAALKRFKADDGRLMVTLYLPDAIYKWQSRSTVPEYGIANGYGTQLEERHVDGETWPLTNPLGVVPVVELAVNAGLKARPFGGGISEFGPVIVDQDRVNKDVFDRLATQESQAFRQRYAIGYRPPVDPETGEPDPRATFRASQSRLWTFPKDVEVGEFGAAEFTGLLACFEADVAILAVKSFTPQSYLPLDLKNLGAETIALTNMGYFAKTKRHRDNLSESFEEITRLCLLVEDDPRADDVQSQILWDGIEVHTLGEIVDAALKMKSLGVPDEVIWQMLPDVAQQDVNMWKAMGAAADLFAPVAPVAPALPAAPPSRPALPVGANGSHP